MRTKTLIVCLAIGLLTSGQATRGAGNSETASPHSASFESKHRARQTHRIMPVSERTVSGVIPRAIYGGNLLQLLNPFAPTKYGTAEENVSLDPDIPGKATGVDLLTFSF